jgi:plasmid stability protein
MSVNVSVKNVPDDIVEKLRTRAKRHHRSLQGELMAILEEATGLAGLSVDQAEIRLTSLGLSSAGDATRWTRELRDAR